MFCKCRCRVISLALLDMFSSIIPPRRPQQPHILSLRSCTSSLQLIPPPSQPGKMAPHHTTMRRHDHDAVTCLLTNGVSLLQTNKHDSTCWSYCHGHALPPSWSGA